MMIFVPGPARSGTTLMSRILGGHPEVYRFKELNFFEELWAGSQGGELTASRAVRLAERLMKNQYEHYLSPTDPAHYRPQAEAFVAEHPGGQSGLALFERFLKWETHRCGKSIPCTHTPRNIYYLREILESYDDAVVIRMIRDPRAVLCSQKFRFRRRLFEGKHPDRFNALRAKLNYHPITYSLIWRGAYRAGEAFRGDDRVLPVRFEELVGKPGATVRELMARLDLEFRGEMLRVPIRGSSLRSDSEGGLGFDRAAVDRWRRGCLSRTEIFLCERITASEMAREAYGSIGGATNWLRLALYLTVWLPQLGLAVLLNMKRTRNPLGALWHRLAPAE